MPRCTPWTVAAVAAAATSTSSPTSSRTSPPSSMPWRTSPEGPVDLLGHSFGGFCALEAARLTTAVRRLVLYEPPLLPDPTPPGLVKQLAGLVAEGRREEVIETFFHEVVGMPPDQLQTLRSLPFWPARVAAAHTLPRGATDGRRLHLRSGSLRVADGTTLLLEGSDSPRFLRASVQAAATAPPHSRVLTLAGQQHIATVPSTPTSPSARPTPHRLGFDNASFDAVVAGFLLPHLADHAAVVAGFARILVHGGRLALSTWEVPERVPILGAVVAAVAEVGAAPPADLPPAPPFFRYSDDSALAGLLRDADLTDVEVSTHTFTHHVTSADAL